MKNSTRSNQGSGHTFAKVPSADIPRSSFDRSHGLKTTFNAGQIIPILVDEALPGDTFNLKTSGFARLSTPIFPIMDNMYLDTFYFSVPVRLLWDNWQKMMGEQDAPGDSTDYLVPQTSPPEGGYLSGGLQDYMGLPTKVDGIEHSALFLRAYNLIFNEWFRDQNIEEPLPQNTGDGPDNYLDYFFAQFRAKPHDYFTSALPWPQKGPDIEIPLGTQAPISGIGAPDFSSTSTARSAVVANGLTPRVQTYNDAFASGQNQFLMRATSPTGSIAQPDIYADLSNATAATINQLRQSFQVQKMYERDARGGTRYTEIIRSHFGVTSPDGRLQRPEYLGGGTTPVNINPIHSTASNDDGLELGDLSAVGTAAFQGHGFTKSFTEHCIIIGLANVRADVTYQQGLNRMFKREDRLDFFWPALSGIGEQEITNSEIYAQGNAEDDAVFGYQERYAEYRYKPSVITGLFRSNYSAGTLDAWHLSQNFTDLPTLSPNFIRNVPPMDRVIAVPSEPDFIADFWHKMICARPMPLYGVPGNIDRF